MPPLTGLGELVWILFYNDGAPTALRLLTPLALAERIPEMVAVFTVIQIKCVNNFLISHPRRLIATRS